jgi:AbrB family looped-hinge helix DNA binding protein
MEATLTSKGQVTIPLSVRRKLNLHKGSVIKFSLKEKSAVVTVKPSFSDSYGKFNGFWGGKDPADEIREWRKRSESR